MHMDMMWIGIGALMLFGSFATIASPSSSIYDQDFGLILLVAGVVTTGVGLGLIDIATIKGLLP